MIQSPSNYRRQQDRPRKSPTLPAISNAASGLVRTSVSTRDCISRRFSLHQFVKSFGSFGDLSSAFSCADSASFSLNIISFPQESTSSDDRSSPKLRIHFEIRNIRANPVHRCLDGGLREIRRDFRQIRHLPYASAGAIGFPASMTMSSGASDRTVGNHCRPRFGLLFNKSSCHPKVI